MEKLKVKIVSEKPKKTNEEIKSKMDKTVLLFLNKSKKKNYDENHNKKCDERFLISINVLGSAGSLRFVVNGDDCVEVVIERALKVYAREGRLPALGLGYDVNNFILYSAKDGFDALKLSDAIGLNGVRNFVLCKNQIRPHVTEARAQVIDRKWSGWRVWLRKSFER